MVADVMVLSLCMSRLVWPRVGSYTEGGLRGSVVEDGGSGTHDGVAPTVLVSSFCRSPELSEDEVCGARSAMTPTRWIVFCGPGYGDHMGTTRHTQC